MQASLAKEEADYNEAVLQLEVSDQLFKDDLIPEKQLKLAKARVQNLEMLIGIDKQRLESQKKSSEAQLAVQEAALERAKAEFVLKQWQVDALKVKAGLAGVLEQVKVEVGQRIAAGSVLAKVSNPRKLKAALKIPETQARDVVLGQKAVVDTRNSLLDGHVVRINPASESGSVTVDVTLETALPREARPDLSVDGTIELERLENVLYVGRPVYGQSDSTVSLFKLLDPSTAVRIPVKFGRNSVNTIEIINGLDVGDQVILSDTHEWDGYERLRVR
jgi:HlyD family secretion protein